MIPRHQPAYRWTDWCKALLDRRTAEECEAALAERLRERLGRKHVLFYSRARDAIYAYFSRIVSGRTVIMPAFTCCVVPEAIRNAGCPMQFVDIDPLTLNLEPAGLAGVAPPAGAVLVLTHQWGIPCQAGELVRWADRHQVRIFEDCASALGAEVNGRPCGSFGEVSILSFESTKLLGAGRLGVLLTDDDAIAEALRADQEDFLPASRAVLKLAALLKVINHPALYRATFGLWSWRQGDYYSDHGEQRERPAAYYRQRPHRFAPALALAQWPDLARRMAHRAGLAEVYAEAFGSFPAEATFRANPQTRPSLIRQPIRARDKRGFYERMFLAGVDLGWSFAYAVVPGPQLAQYPVAARVAEQILNLPIHEGVSLADARKISRLAREFLQ